jgi:hypothetical protein
LALGRAFVPFFFWTFDDCFLRLAIVDPLFWLALRRRIDARLKDNPPRVGTTHPKGYQQTFSRWARYGLWPIRPGHHTTSYIVANFHAAVCVCGFIAEPSEAARRMLSEIS